MANITWNNPVKILDKVSIQNVSVNVKTNNAATLSERHNIKIIFGLNYESIPAARAAPIVYPKYTTLPSDPN